MIGCRPDNDIVSITGRVATGFKKQVSIMKRRYIRLNACALSVWALLLETDTASMVFAFLPAE